MPRLNKITLTDRRYGQTFISKSEELSIPPDLLPGEQVLDVNVASTYPETGCVSIDYDCNWFLAAGTISQTIPSCQLGIIDPLNPASQPSTVPIVFPGSVTYEVRPGKINRQGFKAWANPFLAQPVPYICDPDEGNTLSLINFNTEFGATERKFNRPTVLGGVINTTITDPFGTQAGVLELTGSQSAELNMLSSQNSFCIEFYVRHSSSPASINLIDLRSSAGSDDLNFYSDSNGALVVSDKRGGTLVTYTSASNVFTVNSWDFVKIDFSILSTSADGYINCHVNNELVIRELAYAGGVGFPLSMKIGNDVNGSSYQTRYFSNLRVSSRVTLVESPPTQPFGISTCSEQVKHLDYASLGDNQGLVYYLGTNKLTTSFTSPAVSNQIDTLSSSQLSGSSDNLVDRTSSMFQSISSPNSWVAMKIPDGYLLSVNYYYLVGRTDIGTQTVLKWKLQGCNDIDFTVSGVNAASWTDIDIEVSYPFSYVGHPQSFKIPPSQYFQYFRILMTGTDANNTYFLTMSEWEMYGTYIPVALKAPNGIPTPVPPPTGIPLTYASFGDTNGLFYYMGTNGLTTGWVNPLTTSNALASTTLTPFSAEFGDVLTLADRAPIGWASDNFPSSWVVFDVGMTDKMKVKDYILKSRSSNPFVLPRDWRLEGTNSIATWDVAGVNAATWTNIQQESSNPALSGAATWGRFFVDSDPPPYRYLRLLQYGSSSTPGFNYFTIGEVEFYGNIITS